MTIMILILCVCGTHTQKISRIKTKKKPKKQIAQWPFVVLQRAEDTMKTNLSVHFQYNHFHSIHFFPHGVMIQLNVSL